MRRAVARGRVFPQYYSTDRRYGRLSLKAVALFPLLWVNADDQGRLCGDPEEVKYSVCPNVDHITKADVPGILKDLEDNKLIEVYETPKSPAIQILDWWDPHRAPQWAWPSDYPPPEGWQDHLRYKKDAKTVYTEHWPVSGEHSGDGRVVSQVSNGSPSGEHSGETTEKPLSLPQTPILISNRVIGKGKGGRRGRGNSPEDSGEEPSPPLVSPPLFQFLVDTHDQGWGRKPDSRETSQLRDLAEEISSAGGATEQQVQDAFREAAAQNKYHISYVRAILLDWLGVERVRAP